MSEPEIVPTTPTAETIHDTDDAESPARAQLRGLLVDADKLVGELRAQIKSLKSETVRRRRTIVGQAKKNQELHDGLTASIRERDRLTDAVAVGTRDHARLRSQYDQLLAEHVSILRSAASLNELVATYRRRYAESIAADLTARQQAAQAPTMHKVFVETKWEDLPAAGGPASSGASARVGTRVQVSPAPGHEDGVWLAR